MPEWIPHLIVMVAGMVVALFAGLAVFRALRGLIVLLLISAFLATALEPAVNYLAKRGWQATALDINEDSLQRCQHLAKVNQVELTTLQQDLEGSSPEINTLSADLVLVMRYLHRPLFPVIDRMIRPGGAIIYSTFMIGCEQFGSPRNPNYLLKPGELNSTFSNYQVIVDEQRKLADGRPVTLFVGIKDPNNNA